VYRIPCCVFGALFVLTSIPPKARSENLPDTRGENDAPDGAPGGAVDSGGASPAAGDVAGDRASGPIAEVESKATEPAYPPAEAAPAQSAPPDVPTMVSASPGQKVIVVEKEVPAKRKPTFLSIGVGAPLCGFARGVVDGLGCVWGTEGFYWGNLSIKYHLRVSQRFSVGGGITASVITLEGLAIVGGHVSGDFRVYAVPDYLYFKLDVHVGFPMVLGLAPAMGHAFRIGDRVNIFIENQFIMVVFAGVYGFWQPILGVDVKF
jgi:hypothetical protein